MDIHGSTRIRPRNAPPRNPLLSAYPHASQTSESAAAVDELSEDDIFTTDISEPADHHHHHHNNLNYNNNSNKKTNFSENFGILAALPESPTHCYHKSSVSSCRAIPGIPKPPPHQECSPFRKLQYQSAPVNVPVLVTAMRNRRKFDDMEEDDNEDGGEMVLPPHEIVARADVPVVACSVLKGVGRTLKGRDQRQVRNAVFRQTGFLD